MKYITVPAVRGVMFRIRQTFITLAKPLTYGQKVVKYRTRQRDTDTRQSDTSNPNSRPLRTITDRVQYTSSGYCMWGEMSQSWGDQAEGKKQLQGDQVKGMASEESITAAFRMFLLPVMLKWGDHLYHHNSQIKMQSRCRARLFGKMDQHQALHTVLGKQGADKVPILLEFTLMC